MSTTLSDTPAVCDYCGKANPERLPFCAGCGTRLVAETEPAPAEVKQAKPKSRLLAVCLSLIFGPLGLLYVNAWGTAFLMFLVAGLLLVTRGGGLWAAFALRIFCAGLAYSFVVENDEGPLVGRDSKRLLEKAARLENTDIKQAIAVYEEIIQLYPNAPASKEAARNIQILTRPAKPPDDEF